MILRMFGGVILIDDNGNFELHESTNGPLYIVNHSIERSKKIPISMSIKTNGKSFEIYDGNISKKVNEYGICTLIDICTEDGNGIIKRCVTEVEDIPKILEIAFISEDGKYEELTTCNYNGEFDLDLLSDNDVKRIISLYPKTFPWYFSCFGKKRLEKIDVDVSKYNYIDVAENPRKEVPKFPAVISAKKELDVLSECELSGNFDKVVKNWPPRI